jgi:DNA-binding NtrC family response regulator
MKSRARVLVIDDEHLMRKLVRGILIKEGYSVATASGPQDALQKLGNSRFDIAITDLRMPEVDGFTFITELRQLHPDTGLIVMTGFGDAGTADEVRRRGADEYITKPFNEREIQVIVERVCWRRMVARKPLGESAASPPIAASQIPVLS